MSRTPSQSWGVTIYIYIYSKHGIITALAPAPRPTAITCSWLWYLQALLIKGKLEALRHPASAGPRLRGRAASWTPLSQILVKVQQGSSSPHCTEWADDQPRPAGLEPQLVPDLPLLINSHYNRVSDLASSPVWQRQIYCTCSGIVAESINLLLAMTQARTVQQWQTWGRKVPNFGWATFGWASFVLLV